MQQSLRRRIWPDEVNWTRREPMSGYTAMVTHSSPLMQSPLLEATYHTRHGMRSITCSRMPFGPRRYTRRERSATLLNSDKARVFIGNTLNHVAKNIHTYSKTRMFFVFRFVGLGISLLQGSINLNVSRCHILPSDCSIYFLAKFIPYCPHTKVIGDTRLYLRPA